MASPVHCLALAGTVEWVKTGYASFVGSPTGGSVVPPLANSIDRGVQRAFGRSRRGLCMIETVVESIRVSLVTQHRVVILKEVNGDRHLPIWIGQYEADAIAMELQGQATARPLPYDLLKNAIGDLGGMVERILVTDLNADVFYARIVVAQNGRSVELDSRPSDAIALAVRAHVPILVDESVMDRAGVTLNGDGDDAEEEAAATPALETENVSPADEERLSVFRDFINTLDLDDFDKRQRS